MKTHSYFRSSGYSTEPKITSISGYDIDLQQIPSFLRTLMVTDGTVTKSLEAWFWEPINIIPINNTLDILTQGVDGLEVVLGDKILQREVYLKGNHSEQFFAAARSTVSLKHLPKKVGHQLEEGIIGIGELLREQGVETYRDIFDIDYMKSTPKDDVLLKPLQGEVLSRSYRIRVNGHPAIIVTEYFPVDIFT